MTGKALDKQHLYPGTNTGGGIPYFLSYVSGKTVDARAGKFIKCVVFGT